MAEMAESTQPNSSERHDAASVFAVEDNQGYAFFVTSGGAWTAITAGYAQFPEPCRERDGHPVIVNKEPGSFRSLRLLLEPYVTSEASSV